MNPFFLEYLRTFTKRAMLHKVADEDTTLHPIIPTIPFNEWDKNPVQRPAAVQTGAHAGEDPHQAEVDRFTGAGAVPASQSGIVNWRNRPPANKPDASWMTAKSQGTYGEVPDGPQALPFNASPTISQNTSAQVPVQPAQHQPNRPAIGGGYGGGGGGGGLQGAHLPGTGATGIDSLPPVQTSVDSSGRSLVHYGRGMFDPNSSRQVGSDAIPSRSVNAQNTQDRINDRTSPLPTQYSPIAQNSGQPNLRPGWENKPALPTSGRVIDNGKDVTQQMMSQTGEPIYKNAPKQNVSNIAHGTPKTECSCTEWTKCS